MYFSKYQKAADFFSVVPVIFTPNVRNISQPLQSYASLCEGFVRHEAL